MFLKKDLELDKLRFLLSGTYTGGYLVQHNIHSKSKLKTYNLILYGITESPKGLITTKDAYSKAIQQMLWKTTET
jgi:hypothetical protein